MTPPRRRPARPGRRPAPATKGAAPATVHDPDGTRLQKLLAAAGVGSRRACEQLIAAGRVTVDGGRVTELGTRIDPATRVVHVDGERVQLDASRTYLVLNKPAGVVSTMRDEQGRPCLADYVGARPDRLFHVGRLDAETTGLLLLTNDGELAHRLVHPAYEIEKCYVAQIPGPVPRTLGRTLRAGVDLEDGPVAVDGFRVVQAMPGRALVEVVLHEGRKHVVRRMFETVGHPVLSLSRTRIGPIELGSLGPGRTRVLSRAEVGKLYAAVQL